LFALNFEAFVFRTYFPKFFYSQKIRNLFKNQWSYFLHDLMIWFSACRYGTMRDNVISLKVCSLTSWSTSSFLWQSSSYTIYAPGGSSQWRCGQDSFSCSKECCRVCYLVLFYIKSCSLLLCFFPWTGERGGDI